MLPLAAGIYSHTSVGITIPWNQDVDDILRKIFTL